MHTDIRSKDEIEAWLKNDPIVLFERYLLKNNIMTDEELKILMDIIKSEVEEALKKAVNNSMPSEEEVLKYVFR